MNIESERPDIFMSLLLSPAEGFIKISKQIWGKKKEQNEKD